MVHVIASVYIKENKFEAFMEIFKPNVKRVLEEKGCIEFSPTIDLDINEAVQELDSNVLTIVEKWETLEDLNKHGVAPHMETYHKAVKDLVQKVKIKVLQDLK